MECHSSDRVSKILAFQYDKGMTYISRFSVPFFRTTGAQVSLDAEVSQLSIDKVRMSAIMKTTC